MTEEEVNNIKMLIFLILVGKGTEENKATWLAAIADKCGIAGEDDFKVLSEYSATAIFVDSSLDILENAQDNDYDRWCNLLKSELEKIENYELLSELSL